MIWCDMMWCHITSCHVIRCNVIWCDILWYDVMWCGMTWYDVMSCDVMACYVMPAREKHGPTLHHCFIQRYPIPSYPIPSYFLYLYHLVTYTGSFPALSHPIPSSLLSTLNHSHQSSFVLLRYFHTQWPDTWLATRSILMVTQTSKCLTTTTQMCKTYNRHSKRKLTRHLTSISFVWSCPPPLPRSLLHVNASGTELGAFLPFWTNIEISRNSEGIISNYSFYCFD